MRAIIGGGCLEHGRNCYVLEGTQYSIMVDCGIKKGVEDDKPCLTKEQIKRTRYLFLTHSHLDHAGALSWLYDNGFHGTVILTKKTYNQISDKPHICEFIHVGDMFKNYRKQEEDLTFFWGKSGHCVGGVWYYLLFEDKKIFFSGDYCPTSLVYTCDNIRGFTADLAFIDCAYGNDLKEDTYYTNQLISFIEELITQNKTVFLPVPKFGRGMEILYLLLEKGFHEIYLDSFLHNIVAMQKSEELWYQREISGEFKALSTWKGEEACILMAADPQLKKNDYRQLSDIVTSQVMNQAVSQKVIEKISKVPVQIANQEAEQKIIQFNQTTNQGKVILTGNAEEGSYSKWMLERKRAEYRRYYVHQSLREVFKLCSQNYFKRVILVHCASKISPHQGPFEEYPKGSIVIF